MTRFHLAGALLAFGSLAILPACTTTTTRASNPAPVYASNPELSPGMVRQVQTALQQQGMYNGSIDGIWGPQTQAAVQSFQQAHALSPTGRLSSPTLAALNLPDNGTAPAAAATNAATPDAAAPAMQSSTAPATTTTNSAAPVASAPAMQPSMAPSTTTTSSAASTMPAAPAVATSSNATPAATTP